MRHFWRFGLEARRFSSSLDLQRVAVCPSIPINVEGSISLRSLELSYFYLAVSRQQSPPIQYALVTFKTSSGVSRRPFLDGAYNRFCCDCFGIYTFVLDL